MAWSGSKRRNRHARGAELQQSELLRTLVVPISALVRKSPKGDYYGFHVSKIFGLIRKASHQHTIVT